MRGEPLRLLAILPTRPAPASSAHKVFSIFFAITRAKKAAEAKLIARREETAAISG
jgi:hypothetical protein